MCHVSHVTCHVSWVNFQMTQVKNYRSFLVEGLLLTGPTSFSLQNHDHLERRVEAFWTKSWAIQHISDCMSQNQLSQEHCPLPVGKSPGNLKHTYVVCSCQSVIHQLDRETFFLLCCMSGHPSSSLSAETC